MPREISIGAVIFYQEKDLIQYLILYRQGDEHHRSAWLLPRGKKEIGENDYQTVKREIKEETGLDNLRFITGFRKQHSWFFKDKNKEGKAITIYKTAVYYLVQVKNKEVKISSEHNDFAWLDLKEAYAKLTFDGDKEIIKAAQERILKLYPQNFLS